MRTKKQINEALKFIEEEILEGRATKTTELAQLGLYLESENHCRGARKALMWVMEGVKKRKKKDDNNKKLQKFGIENPIQK